MNARNKLQPENQNLQICRRKDVIKLLDFIYKDCHISLNRKYELYKIMLKRLEKKP
jgi:hypothetical protein